MNVSATPGPEPGTINITWPTPSAAAYEVEYRIPGSGWRSMPFVPPFVGEPLPKGVALVETRNKLVSVQCEGRYRVFGQDGRWSGFSELLEALDKPGVERDRAIQSMKPALRFGMGKAPLNGQET